MATAPASSPEPVGSPASGRPGPVVHVARGGEATDEEVAAIVAAVEVTWPRPAAPAAPPPPQRWRFSGRWWTKPVPLTRQRP